MKRFGIILTVAMFGLIVLLESPERTVPVDTFTNPLLPSGADPWCIYKNGYYFYTNTTGNNIKIWKTKNIGKLATAENKIIFIPPVKGAYSKELWAPEIHFLNGKWYIYFAADSGRNIDHRLWVLENSSADPLSGEWIMKGKLTTPDDKWSIDGLVYAHKNNLYLLWSGWEGGYQRFAAHLYCKNEQSLDNSGQQGEAFEPATELGNTWRSK